MGCTMNITKDMIEYVYKKKHNLLYYIASRYIQDDEMKHDAVQDFYLFLAGNKLFDPKRGSFDQYLSFTINLFFKRYSLMPKNRTHALRTHSIKSSSGKIVRGIELKETKSDYTKFEAMRKIVLDVLDHPKRREVYLKIASGRTPISISKELGVTKQAISAYIKHMAKDLNKTLRKRGFVDAPLAKFELHGSE